MPDHQNVLSILLTMTGICLLTLQQSLVFHSGDILCLAGAAVYAVQILLTDKFAQEEDGMLLGIWQLGFAALYGVICTFMFETPTLPSSGFQWIAILGLAFVCSAFGFVMQPMAQKYTTPEHTGLLFALEPVFSAVFSYIFLHETLSGKGYMGAMLVMAGVVAASVVREKRQPVRVVAHQS
ncbi:MAG: DMT family transporter [Coprococcus sp.]